MIRLYDPNKLLTATLDRRLFTRKPSRTLAQLNWKNQNVVVDLVDIANGGAGCTLSAGISPEIDDQVRLTLLDRTSIDAVVRWVSHKKIGLEFDCNLLLASDHLNYEHLGGQYFAQLFKLQSQRQEQALAQTPYIND